MSLVSIILPSLRLELARQSLLAIERCSGLVQHEVILVSPFELREPNVRWIQETEPRGNSAAQRQGYMAAQGDYLLHISYAVFCLKKKKQTSLPRTSTLTKCCTRR